jgi:coenzyme F420-0:L-glutamate ligase
MKVEAIRTRVFRQGDDLLGFITEHVRRLEENSVLAVTSKIVSLSEGRVREVIDEHTREQVIREESQWAIKTKYTWLTIKDGIVMASAGVDESNADGKIILLPSDCFESAEKIRTALRKEYGVKNLGVLITDSRIYPLRAGLAAVAMGYAGFKGIRDYRGKSDIFGRKFSFTRTDVADSLATAAVLEMGEGAEQQPLAVITGAPVEFADAVSRDELKIDVRDDMYQPVFEHIREIKWPNDPPAVLKGKE